MVDVEVELLHVAEHHGRGGVRGRSAVPQHHVRRCPGGSTPAHQVLPHHPAAAHCTEVRYTHLLTTKQSKQTARSMVMEVERIFIL